MKQTVVSCQMVKLEGRYLISVIYLFKSQNVKKRSLHQETVGVKGRINQKENFESKMRFHFVIFHGMCFYEELKICKNYF